MPRVVVKEYDKTNAGFIASNNFSVVVPGFVADGKTSNFTAENNWTVELTSQTEFEDKVGKVKDKDNHCGNRIAYLLLGLGYTVLYRQIGAVPDLVPDDFWAPFKDKSVYNFRYIISGLLKDSGDTNKTTVAAVNTAITKIVNNTNTSETELDTNGRGDAIALLDISTDKYSGKSATEAITNIKAAATEESTYAMYIAPSVYYKLAKDSVYDEDVTTDVVDVELPASFHYLACAAYSMARYSEWFAVSGYTRGISNLTISKTAVKLGDAAANALQPRKKQTDLEVAVNLVAYKNGSYYIWGNRTAEKLTDDGLIASHFLNIRQLCCTLKKVIYSTCQHLMFDPNSDVLWGNFCNAIRPTLEAMKANQGIKDYKFEKQETSQKAKLFAAIRIIPIEAVEDFEIGITLEDNFDQATITIDEKLK